MRYYEIIEKTTMKSVKPLTPKQAAKRAERDRKRQERITGITSSAAKRITDIKSRMGQ